MNKLVHALTSYTETENGALTFKSTGKDILDYFSRAGAMRLHGGDSVPLFVKAYQDDPMLALKTLFYFRDIRGGQGERKLFRDTLTWLYDNQRVIFDAVVPLTAEYGCWKDIVSFVDSKVVRDLVMAQLMQDMNSDHPTLLGKWMPSENASSVETKRLAKAWMRNLHLTARDYRKMLTHLRTKVGIVESAMSSGNWGEINYARVPSLAMKNYRSAFGKHDYTRFSDYLTKVEKGESKINSAALYPYQIYNAVHKSSSEDRVLEAQWKALPDYITTGENILVMADVSGSMSGDPIAVSISLALYSAERGKGAFKDMFMTFSSNPALVEVKGRTLREKMNNISRANWDMSTNLQAAFNKILTTATRYNVPQSDMPTKLFVITDMEFDSSGSANTNFEVIKRKYQVAGYTMPTLVFWNVNARGSHSPVRFDERGVMLVSGLSPSIFKAALESNAVTPYDMMLDTLGNERYNAVEEVITSALGL